MSLLIEDLAEETAASNRRLAERLDAEARELGDARDAHRHSVERVMSAQQAADFAISHVPVVEDIWRMALATLRMQPVGDTTDRILRSLIAVTTTGQQLVSSARMCVELAQRVQTTTDRLNELRQAECRLAKMAEDAKRSLQHRDSGWRPADPERLAAGLQLAREGKTIPADQARTWF